jgi:hypothetical protein
MTAANRDSCERRLAGLQVEMHVLEVSHRCLSAGKRREDQSWPVNAQCRVYSPAALPAFDHESKSAAMRIASDWTSKPFVSP